MMIKTSVFLLTLFDTGKHDPQKDVSEAVISLVPPLALCHGQFNYRKQSYIL